MSLYNRSFKNGSGFCEVQEQKKACKLLNCKYFNSDKCKENCKECDLNYCNNCNYEKSCNYEKTYITKDGD